MELRNLKTFRTVATLLSFNQAAEVLNYAQSTVSSQIKALEDELAVRLFDRLGKRIVLTPAGVMLSQYAQKMLDIEAETLSEVRNQVFPHGSLSIRVPQTIGLHFMPAILSRFQVRFPGVGCRFHRCAFHALEHELQTGVTDLAFLFAESARSACLTVEPLRFEPLILVTNPKNPLVSKEIVTPEDLRDHPIFLPGEDCGYRMVFEAILAEHGVEPRIVLDFNSIEMMRECLKVCTGVAVMPEVAVKRELHQSELTALRWSEQGMETAILMIRHKDRWISPALRAFMETATEVIGASEL